MRTLLIGAALAACAAAGSALAEDNEAGVPLTPAEAAGVWTLSTGGHDVCSLTLTAAHGVKAGQGCAGLIGSPTAWQPTSDGMALTGGRTIGFHRWSNSLFVSRRETGLDVQLRRGGPVPTGT
jgi:hypothetical protein